MRKWAITSWIGIAALAAGLVVALVQHNTRAITYVGLHLAVALAVVLLSRPPDLLTVVLVFALDFNAPGWGWRWLDVLWHYDDFAHVLVTMAVTPHVARLLLPPLGRELLAHRLLLALILISLGLAGNALWEIFEWICDHFVTPSGQMSIQDTMLDLISDAIGAALAVPFGVYGLKRRMGDAA